MKIRWIFALGLLVAVLISCQCLRKRSSQGGVQIKEDSILIPPTAISKADQEALNNIFRQYDRSLYRIAVYENGKLTKQLGTMPEMQLADVTKDYARSATATGLTSWTFQFIARTHVTHYGPTRTRVSHLGQPSHVTRAEATPSGQPTHVTTGEPTHVTHHKFASMDEEADALVKEVTPILEKYSK